MTVYDFRSSKNDEIGRLAMRAKVIDSYLKQDGTVVVRAGTNVIVSFVSEAAAEWFEQVINDEFTDLEGSQCPR